MPEIEDDAYDCGFCEKMRQHNIPPHGKQYKRPCSLCMLPRLEDAADTLIEALIGPSETPIPSTVMDDFSGMTCPRCAGITEEFPCTHCGEPTGIVDASNPDHAPKPNCPDCGKPAGISPCPHCGADIDHFLRHVDGDQAKVTHKQGETGFKKEEIVPVRVASLEEREAEGKEEGEATPEPVEGEDEKRGSPVTTEDAPKKEDP